ncbi:MAG TPA: hypothetical protein VGF61_22955, partial [Candidatus Acidoferrum sp.]
MKMNHHPSLAGSPRAFFTLLCGARLLARILQCKIKVVAIVVFFAAAIGLPTAKAITYDLKAQWSNSSNPNGVWSYDQGTNPLPFQANWRPGDYSGPQPAWARSADSNTFLPAWLKLSTTPTQPFPIDMQIGDVGLHTTDTTNGVGAGPGNVTWTSPITGNVDLSGSVWEARNIGRSNHWSLTINGNLVSGGDISAANSSRSSPFDLASGTGGPGVLNNISVFAGEVIKLQFDETSPDAFGDFVGVNFTVEALSCTTNPATTVASFSATLNGSLNPRGSTTTVYFQYGPTTSYGHTTPVQTQIGNTVRNISANISGLTASTTYHFRIVAHDNGGTSFGSDRTFTTLSPTGPPVVITSPATLLASFSATLNGSVDPHGLTTSVHFQYGTTTSYGLTTAPQSHTGNTFGPVSANISGLLASHVYHYRIVASNSAGTTFGSDRTFTTLSATGAPVVTTNPATNVAIS